MIGSRSRASEVRISSVPSIDPWSMIAMPSRIAALWRTNASTMSASLRTIDTDQILGLRCGAALAEREDARERVGGPLRRVAQRHVRDERVLDPVDLRRVEPALGVNAV